MVICYATQKVCCALWLSAHLNWNYIWLISSLNQKRIEIIERSYQIPLEWQVVWWSNSVTWTTLIFDRIIRARVTHSRPPQLDLIRHRLLPFARIIKLRPMNGYYNRIRTWDGTYRRISWIAVPSLQCRRVGRLTESIEIAGRQSY